MMKKNIYRTIIQWKYILLALFFPLFSGIVKGQFYEYGQDPGNVKWQKIESTHFKVIFPSEIQRDAKKLIYFLEKNYKANNNQLQGYPKKTPVILHTHTVNSNGFATWAPKRTEFFMFPDIQPISQEWYSHLSLHEYRHMVQVEKMNSGITRLLTTFLGEQGIGPAAGITPFWLYEGDAVYAETSLSKSGRGRSPQFEMGIKAQLLESEKTFSFTKSYLGSYIDYVPSYYEYGYQMVSYARQQYGNDIWSGAFDYTGRKPFLLNPLYFYLKKEGAGSKRKLYDSASIFLKKHWSENLKNRYVDDYNYINKEKNKIYTSYNSPQATGNNSVIAIKSNSKKIDRFVEILENGSEKTLFIPGYLNSDRISYSHGKILWDEYIPGARYRNHSYSIIREYNTETGSSRNLTLASRYTSPSYSWRGDTIVCIETSLSNDFHLVFLSSLDGGQLDKVPSPDNIQLLDPAWIKNSDKILAIGLSEKGKSLLIYDRSDHNWEEILPPSETDISRPVYGQDLIAFHATYEGVDNIYALNTKDKQLFRITDARYGAFEPDFDPVNGELFFSVYSSEGYNISGIPTDSILLKIPDLASGISEQPFFSYRDNKYVEAEDIPENTEISDPKKYMRLSHLFRFHSWAPFYFDYSDPDIEELNVSPGISLLSQNLLSTATTYLGWEYSDKTHFFHTGFTYKGWLPVIDFSYDYGGDSFVVPSGDTAVSNPTTASKTSYNLSAYIPLSTIMGKWIIGMQPYARLSYSSDYFYYSDPGKYIRGMTYLDSYFYGYIYHKTATLDLIPRWGIILDLRSLSAPFEDEQRGSISSVKTSVYLPGLFTNHGIKLQNQWQEQKPETWLYSNLLGFPRGIEDYTSENLYKFSADYYLPLLYPDLNLEGVLYLKRIKAQLFYDYLYGEGVRMYNEGRLVSVNGSFSSWGAEVRFDYHLFRILFELSSGIRLSYVNNTGKIVPEFIYSFDLNSF